MSSFSRRSLLQLISASAVAASCTARNTIVPTPLGTAPLRLMTFNIQSGSRGLDGVVEVIRAVQPDVVALQEVDRFSTRAGGKDQAAEVAAATGLVHHRHFRATDYYGGQYGLAIVSRFPIEDFAQIPLPVPAGQEPRTMGRALLSVDGQPLSVYVTHLSHLPTNAAVRAAQAKLILAQLAADPHPKVLMGDLNDGASSPALRLFKDVLVDAFDRAGEGSAGTYPLPLFLPALRLDYVLGCAQLAPLRSYVVRSAASDHYPVVAEYRFAAEAQVAERQLAVNE